MNAVTGWKDCTVAPVRLDGIVMGSNVVPMFTSGVSQLTLKLQACLCVPDSMF